MKMNNTIFLIAIGLILASCQNDSIRPNINVGLYERGYFITNEGNFGSGNGSLSFISENGNVSNNIFEQNNSYFQPPLDVKIIENNFLNVSGINVIAFKQNHGKETTLGFKIKNFVT